MTRIKRAALSLLLAVGLIGAALVTATPAQANPTPHCNWNSRICVFEGGNFGGSWVVALQSPGGQHCLTFPYSWMKNNMESAANTLTTWKVVFYDSDHCGGAKLDTLYPNQELAYISYPNRANSLWVTYP